MGLFENGLNIQRAKQASRIMGLAKKPAPNQIAIYRGKDPIDGTDIIQVGANEPVSGYRLISNNPISIGDRVYIRPSKQGFGLQRVDAPNVAKQTLPEVVEDTTAATFVVGNLAFLEIFSLDGGFDFFMQSTNNLVTGGLLEYQYRPKSLFFVKKGAFNFGANTAPDPDGTVVVNFKDDGETQNNFVAFTPNVLPTSDVFANFQVYFGLKDWQEVFNPWLGSYGGSSFFTAPIEVEMSINGVTDSPFLRIGYSEANSLYFITADFFAPPAGVLTFSFRWRKRGTEKWFSLK